MFFWVRTVALKLEKQGREAKQGGIITIIASMKQLQALCRNQS